MRTYAKQEKCQGICGMRRKLVHDKKYCWECGENGTQIVEMDLDVNSKTFLKLIRREKTGEQVEIIKSGWTRNKYGQRTA